MKVFWGILAVIVVTLLLGGYFAYRYIIVRREPEPLPSPDDDISPARRWGVLHYEEQIQWLQQWGWEEVAIENWQGAHLAGYLFLAKEPTTRTALCIHGYHCHGLRDYLYIAQMYLEKFGMNVLIVDNHAHGNSEGKRIGFGYNDSIDCIQWAEWLEERFGPECEVLLHGISMGANTVVNAVGDESLPECVHWAVEDCGYTSAKDEIKFMIKSRFKVPAFPLYHIASLFNAIFNNHFFIQNNGPKSLQNCNVPMLFVHGTADVTVPFEMGWALYEACPTRKRHLWMQNVGHADCYLSNTEAYYNAVKQLIQ